VNAGGPWPGRTPDNEDPTAAVMKREPRRSSRDIWDYSNPGSSEYFMTINFILTTIRGAHTFLQTNVFCGCNSAKRYDINTQPMSFFYITFCEQTSHLLCVRMFSTSTRVTSVHGTILNLSANVDIKSSSAVLASDLVMGPYLICERLTSQRYRDFLEIILRVLLGYMSPAGTCPAVVERDIPREAN
jgi:hypothetical protein